MLKNEMSVSLNIDYKDKVFFENDNFWAKPMDINENAVWIWVIVGSAGHERTRVKHIRQC